MKFIKFFIGVAIMTLLISGTPTHSITLPQKDEELIQMLQTRNLRLIVMRHGEAIHNLGHLMCSVKSPGVHLTKRGIRQVQRSAHYLLKEHIDCIYASPVYRTLQTAQLVGMQLKLPYQKMFVEERLREQFYGDFEDRTYEEYEAYFFNFEDVYVEAVPNGESGLELFSRTRDLLWSIVTRHQDETILLVTHAYNCCQISKCLTGTYQELPDKAEYKIYEFNK